MENGIRKAGITYKMIRENEVAETYIDLPISSERYEKLTMGLTPNSKVWKEVRDTLERLTILQGYTKLGAWSIELKIEV